MTAHLSSPQVAAFCARILPVPEMVAAGSHLAVCPACRHLFHEAALRNRNHAPVVVDLSPEQMFRYEHFEYEQLVGYVEERLEQEDREIAEFHLRTCGRCREDVRSFRAYRRQIEPELKLRYGPEVKQGMVAKLTAHLRWLSPILKPVSVGAAIVIVTMTLLAVFLFLKPGSDEQRVREKSLPPAPVVSPQTPVENALRNPEYKTPERASAAPNRSPRKKRHAGAAAPEIATADSVLVDRGIRIQFDQAGRLAGLHLPPETEQSVKDALLSAEIVRPEVLAELGGINGGLRSGEGKQSAFRLLSPGRTVIADDRPTFRWEPLAGAAGYVVQIVDEQQNEVVSSGPLPADATQWRCAAPLKRGVIYTWIVTATVSGEEITSPAAAEPEMKFKVLEEERISELTLIRKSSGSHLALGVFYARVGMPEEAERELQLLARENPRSRIAARLLGSVRAWR